MDDMLKQLKENMDKTILKDLDFQDVNKTAVRKAIYSTNKTKRMRSLYPRILSLGFTCIFIIGISYYGMEKLGFTQNDKPISSQIDNKEVKSNNEVQDTKNIPPKQEENYENMKKEDILTKLFNTVDYFQSASGKFEIYNKYYDDSTSKANVEYKISLKNLIGGYEKIINIPDEKVVGAQITTQEMFYNDKKIWRLENDDVKTYYIDDYEIEPSREIVKPERVFSIPINKMYDSEDMYRERPPSGVSGASLFPYEMGAKYLRFNNLWEIEKQNEELLGHNTIVLHGSIDKSVVDNSQPDEKSFRFWVDKDTGILLKYEIYNEKSEIISYLHPESLSVNVAIDSKQFIPNLDNYQPMEVQERQYKDSREKDIEVVEHADSIEEEVKAVLSILRSKVPFLFEFSNPDLKIFSASMERYKDYKHAYLTYSYKKEENEIGSGSRLIYVRAYHKDSVVSSLGDFNTEKGEELDTFTLKGIKWTVFEIKDNPNAHFIGSSGEYKYEMVTQDVSIDEVKRLLESFKKTGINQ
ncbi:hypothetical protein A361_20430 [Cytobacillus oceanisediminis 2691]|uniref:DUF4367 domain-containing protein n=2 Tax=Cytobacillus oceanisediminis TaxID=665099 RepID=A0A160ME87_9BACI|nr:hypothetical protein A361_20430 [Cytobacillus oceanisediminis 2691]